jgi:hypothetical protein
MQLTRIDAHLSPSHFLTFSLPRLFLLRDPVTFFRVAAALC